MLDDAGLLAQRGFGEMGGIGRQLQAAGRDGDECGALRLAFADDGRNGLRGRARAGVPLRPLARLRSGRRFSGSCGRATSRAASRDASDAAAPCRNRRGLRHERPRDCRHRAHGSGRDRGSRPCSSRRSIWMARAICSSLAHERAPLARLDQARHLHRQRRARRRRCGHG